MIRIVHLSDIHLRKDHLYDAEKFILKALIKDLKVYHQKKPIDLIILTGDLIDRGGITFDCDISGAFDIFQKKLIAPIAESLEISKHKLFFCPGNHDIDRSADQEFEEMGLREMLDCTEKVNDFLATNKPAGIKRIMPFKAFEKAYYKGYPETHEITNFYSSYRTLIDEQDIGITCFNSSWRCYDSKADRGQILLGERQVIKAREITEKCNLRIAVIHHPIDLLAEFDKKAVEHFIHKDYDLLFCGHAHEGASWTSTNYYGGLFVSSAPSNWSFDIRGTHSLASNGYSIIDYDFPHQRIGVYHRKYSHQKEAFVPDTDLGDDHGSVNFDIPRSIELNAIQEELQLAAQIEDMRLDDMNEDLLSYNTDTTAPKRIEKVFVNPRLMHSLEPDPEKEEKEEILEVADLCRTDEHVIIFGPKESGKTILLDKILIDLTKGILRYRKVPVLYDFLETKNRRIETNVSRFLNIPIRDTNEFLEKHDVLLLVDNLTFNDSDKSDLNRLENFLALYPRVRLIATAVQSLEGAVPADFIQFPFYSSFKSLHLRSFKTKEMRALISNWFSNSEFLDTPSKLNKVIDFFTTLNLPRTPLALSMFLWLIEKQENYRPINHAVMLENFIERLFRKLSKSEIYSETFDFTNKQRMLAEVAKKMYDRGLINYRLPYQELSNFIDDSLRSKRFEFLAEEVLQHFLHKGLLVKEVEDGKIFLRFRFNCFFQYFLMKYMEYDREFLDYVLDKDNYLFFADEIDYYTAIRRDKTDILEMLIERMEAEFEEPLALIENLDNTFDDIFATEDTIVSTISEDFVKKLPDERPNEKDVEKLTDEALEAIRPEKGIKKKDREISPLKKLEIHWTLSAKALKNTEETRVAGLKDRCLKSVVKASLAFAALYKHYLEQHIERMREEGKAVDEGLVFGKNIIPLVNELALFGMLGTTKLSAVIRDKMINDLSRRSVSDVEKFISVFLYADIKGKECEKHIKRLVKSIKHLYIFDMTLFKIVYYYFFRSKTKESDKMYENIIADLIVKAKGERKRVRGKVLEKFRDKGKIMDEYRQKKSKVTSDNDPALVSN